MSLRINDEAPNFTAETTQGPINFHQWIGDGWAILFSHPKDFTPVCTTELGYMAGLQPQFEKRNCKIIGLSVDPVSSHGKWAGDIEETQNAKMNFPILGDSERKVASLYEPLHPAVLHVLKSVVEIAKAEAKDISICGEMAGNPAYIELLLGLGVRSVSVSPGEILAIKKVIRSISIERAESLAKQVLELGTVQEIKSCIANSGSALLGTVPDLI
jgi:alkyl hydroperoxide reductase subunit AhpC